MATDWDTEPLPETIDECGEQIVAIQREMHALANRLGAIEQIRARLSRG